MVSGLSNKEIAEKFELSSHTVKHHLTNIFDKVGASNRLELALFALHHRLIEATANSDAEESGTASRSRSSRTTPAHPCRQSTEFCQPMIRLCIHMPDRRVP